jgi:fructose-bisphosphate aldolase class II
LETIKHSINQNELERFKQTFANPQIRRGGRIWSDCSYCVRLLLEPLLTPANKTARYNVEHVTAFVQAANNRKSPLILQLFPSALELTPSLVYAAAAAARSASVPISVHLDHAQNAEQIKYAADNCPFDSIMVDMSHYERAENIEKTRDLKEYCHERKIAVEAETGRIEGGEDGIMDTGDLAGMYTFRNINYFRMSTDCYLAILTTAEDVEDFISADVDAIAPAVGNIHGDYGSKGPELDFER